MMRGFSNWLIIILTFVNGVMCLIAESILIYGYNNGLYALTYLDVIGQPILVIGGFFFIVGSFKICQWNQEGYL